ncbi:hypothetical protein ACJ8QI_09000 [Serratia sp. CY84636]|uniref:hypothetical protein n=1 Tax=Serratia sp. CY84636 TaxID=3383695 RepID=UPI003F9F099A
MDWQGIPFLMKGDEVFYHAEVLLSKIPKIVLEIPDKSSWESFLTALIAGGIPAYVAYRAMKSNTQLVTQQQLQQGKIADKTIKAQVVASSRQVWINEIRDLLSQFAADNRACLKRQWDYFNADNLFQQYALTEQNINIEVFLEERRTAQRMLEDAIRARDEILNKINYVKNRILLMLNHDEAECAALIELMSSIEKKSSNLSEADLKDYRDVSRQLRVDIDYFIICAQKYLKGEWEIIKASI